MNVKRWGKLNKFNWITHTVLFIIIVSLAGYLFKIILEQKIRENEAYISTIVKQELGFPVHFSSMDPGWSGVSLGLFFKNVVVIDAEIPKPFISIARLEVYPSLKDVLFGDKVRVVRMVMHNLKMVVGWDANSGVSVLDLDGEALPTGLDYKTIVNFIREQNKTTFNNAEIVWKLPKHQIEQKITGDLLWVGTDNLDWLLLGQQSVAIENRMRSSFVDFTLLAEPEGRNFSLKLNVGPFSSVCHASHIQDWNLNCAAQGEHISIKELHKYYKPTDNDPKLLQWLFNTLHNGSIVNLDVQGNFLEDNLYYSGEIDFKAANFFYAEGWPKIHNAQGKVIVNTDRVFVNLQAGQVMGVPIQRASALIEPIGAKTNPTVFIEGQLSSTLDKGLSFLEASPLQQSFGQDLKALRLSGPMQLDLKLQIPLSEKPVQVEGHISTDKAKMSIPTTKLSLSKIAGKLAFTEQGLSAENLVAHLFDNPLVMSISTDNPKQKGRVLDVKTEGKLGAQILSKILPENLVEYFAGHSIFVSHFRKSLNANFPSQEWTLESPLKGIAINLPSPLAKAELETWPFKLRLATMEKNNQLEMSLGNVMAAVFNLGALDDALKIQGGNIHFSAKPRVKIEKGILRVDGNVCNLKVDQWSELLKSLKPSEGTALPLHIHLKLFVERLEAFGMKFQEISIASKLTDHWQVDSPHMRGNFFLPEADSEPLFFELDYLKVTDSLKKPQSTGQLLKGAKRSVRFYCKQLRYKENNFGEVLFELAAKPYGYQIKDLTFQTDIFTLSGAGEWRLQDKIPTTRLNGSVKGINMGTMFQRFGYPSAIRDSSGYIDYQFSWPGNPFDFSIQKTHGFVNMKFDQGRILGVDPGLGRIMGLLNIESIKRRLQLDFSDVLEEGFVFDVMQGKLTLDKGFVRTNNLSIDGPSAKIELEGRSNLRTKAIDFKMGVSPHMSTGLPIAAAIAVGNPAIGAGIWLFDKITGSKITQITQHYYQVVGTWDNPVIEPIKASSVGSKK